MVVILKLASDIVLPLTISPKFQIVQFIIYIYLIKLMCLSFEKF
jgi:hypothetical protein